VVAHPAERAEWSALPCSPLWLQALVGTSSFGGSFKWDTDKRTRIVVIRKVSATASMALSAAVHAVQMHTRRRPQATRFLVTAIGPPTHDWQMQQAGLGFVGGRGS
jgi:hypothetical protein